MALYRCKMESGLHVLCKNKVLSGTPTVPTVQSSRINIIEGGYITEGRKVYFYINGTVAVAMNHPSSGIGEFTLLNGFPYPYNQTSYNGFTGVMDKNGYYYDFVFKELNNAYSISFFLDPTDTDLSVGESIVIYGFYISNT